MWAFRLLPPLPRVAVLTSPRQRRGRAVGVGVGVRERCHLTCYFSPSSSLPPSGSRPCHALYASFCHRFSPCSLRLPSFLSPLPASSWPAVLAQEDKDSERAGRGSFAEFLGSELEVQDSRIWGA